MGRMGSEIVPDLKLPFPPGFRWGAATSSHQVEGDNHGNDWWDWELAHPTRIRGGEVSGSACGGWRGQAEHDLRLAASLGHNAHRASLEWSRIEPDPGRFSTRAIDRYREILGAGKDAGLAMYVTLNHFTLPRWVSVRGGWTDRGLPDRFAGYAEHVARCLGDLVEGFLTVNEPAVLAFKAHLQGMWPPGQRDPRAAARSLGGQLRGHELAFERLKAVLPSVPVGIALNIPTVEPARPGHRGDHSAANLEDWLVNGCLLRALRTGRRWPPIGWARTTARPCPLDFIGLNYYGAYQVQLDFGRRPRFVQRPTIRTETADWGKPAPDAFYQVLRRLQSLEVPILVSENGLFDADDSLRPRYIVDHVEAMHRAIHDGAPVFGYLHWSLIDNFEWAQGWTTPFGLVSIDRVTQQRTPKKSAKLFEVIARNNALVGLHPTSASA